MDVVVAGVGEEIILVVAVLADAGGFGLGKAVVGTDGHREDLVGAEAHEFAEGKRGGVGAVDEVVVGRAVEAVDRAGGEVQVGLPVVAEAEAQVDRQVVGIEVEARAVGVAGADAVVVALVGEADGRGKQAVGERHRRGFGDDGNRVGEDDGIDRVVGGEIDVVGVVNLRVVGEGEFDGETAALGDALGAGILVAALRGGGAVGGVGSRRRLGQRGSVNDGVVGGLCLGDRGHKQQCGQKEVFHAGGRRSGRGWLKDRRRSGGRRIGERGDRIGQGADVDIGSMSVELRGVGDRIAA